MTERDKRILAECLRWRGLLARQIKEIASFRGERSLYRRLKILIENGFLEKRRYVYGVPSIYTVTAKAIREINLDYKVSSIRIGQLNHTISVADTYIYFLKKYNLTTSSVISEVELRKSEKFSYRGHIPDFVFKDGEKAICVEVELSLKNKDILEKNIMQNMKNYKAQKWIVKAENKRLAKILNEFKRVLPGIEVLMFEEVRKDLV